MVETTLYSKWVCKICGKAQYLDETADRPKCCGYQYLNFEGYRAFPLDYSADEITKKFADIKKRCIPC